MPFALICISLKKETDCSHINNHIDLFVSYYHTHSLYHFINSAIVAIKSDIVTFYRCLINAGDIWLQFKKSEKNRQMALRYKKIKNKY